MLTLCILMSLLIIFVHGRFVLVLVLVASILTLAVISCDRFFGIVFAMKARVTARRPSLLIAGVWAAAVAVSSPVLIYRQQMTRQWLNHTEIWCADDWPAVSRLFLHIPTLLYRALRGMKMSEVPLTL